MWYFPKNNSNDKYRVMMLLLYGHENRSTLGMSFSGNRMNLLIHEWPPCCIIASGLYSMWFLANGGSNTMSISQSVEESQENGWALVNYAHGRCGELYRRWTTRGTNPSVWVTKPWLCTSTFYKKNICGNLKSADTVFLISMIAKFRQISRGRLHMATYLAS